jgi:hypothetical protein
MIQACPHLPEVAPGLTAESVRMWRGPYGPEAYLAHLRYAQALWVRGNPAQALLQLDRALAADLAGDEEVLRKWPLPYKSMEWIMVKGSGMGFFGNPVRHFQHLASRMSGPRSELRTWRAWACFHLAEQVLGQEGFPRDEEQIERESLRIPGRPEVITRLGGLGHPGEAALVSRALGEA